MNELIDDPTQISKLADLFNATPETTEVVTTFPPSGIVELPGGFLLDDGSIATTAEVRELTGLDEEAIAKASSVNSAMNVILKRGLVSIGDVPASKLKLDGMLIADRDAILLAIRNATFGNDVSYATYCSTCEGSVELTLNLEKDIKVVKLDDPVDDRVFSVDTKAGEAMITLPTLVTNKKLADVDGKSFAEFTTVLLAGCIVSINGDPSLGRETALSLNMKDRQVISEKLLEHSPGPRLSEVMKACGACGTELVLSLSLAELFRI
jgi:hypothetical protein